MALLFNTNFLKAPLNFHSSTKQYPNYSSLCVRCSTNQQSESQDAPNKKKRLSEQSSWEAKDDDGNDYLYRLGAEADNMNIAVGARAGVIDTLFAGNFLGKDSDIVFDYRQKVTRSFNYLQGDYYIAPAFLDKVGKFQSVPPLFLIFQQLIQRDHCTLCMSTGVLLCQDEFDSSIFSFLLNPFLLESIVVF
ncbi:hypothetical protein K7X08_034545 [Anisodus acutangulus]|uniref:Uncharacterized protein n=1 Tax=Anisodus acutangulus TaxID=402998 RepID=A0A9Q1R108_9SOLA|nr:hypothetical protein K7X08_034545 [Anisodus acutangulus]